MKYPTIKTPLGEISVEVSHLSSLSTIQKSLKGELVRNDQALAGYVMPGNEDEDYLEYRARRQGQPQSFKQTLFKALAPSLSNQSLTNLVGGQTQAKNPFAGLGASAKNG